MTETDDIKWAEDLTGFLATGTNGLTKRIAQALSASRSQGRMEGLEEAAKIADAIAEDLRKTADRDERPAFFAHARVVGRVASAIRSRSLAQSPKEA